MARVTNFGKIDTLSVSEEISMPLVIIKEINQTETKFRGFIPALTNKDVITDNLDDCKTALKQKAKKIVHQMAKDNLEFPFFPCKEEITNDFKNVYQIIYIKIKSKKRKSQI